MKENITELTFNDRDEFQRKSIAKKVIILLKSDIDVSPIVIDGGWGTGKTEFCHKTINLMAENDSHHLIYVDAFQADHADEPLLTVLAEVLKIIPEGDKRTGLIQKVLPAIRYGLKTALKAGVSHLLRQEAADIVNDFDKEIQKTADKAIDVSVESLLKDHIKASESIKSLQKALSEIAKQKPIILFVDELDRCRPDFAVNMLEIIKHTFAVEGVQFVLITNSQQLKASINHCYGPTVDAQRYLDKFLKFTFSLPQMNRGETLASTTHYLKLIQHSSKLSNCELDAPAYVDLMTVIIKEHNLSLREIETLIRHLEIYQILSNDGIGSNIIIGYKLLRLIGIILFCFSPKIANLILQEKADAKELALFFNETRIIPMIDGYIDINSAYQIAVSMLAQECQSNSELFHAEKGPHADEFNKSMNSLFSRSFPPSKGKRLNIVIDTLNTLSLSS